MSILDEQVEGLGNDELALVINRFKRFHDNHKNRWFGGWKVGYFNYGDPDHFNTSCQKMKVKQDFGKRRDKAEYTSGKDKSRGRKRYK